MPPKIRADYTTIPADDHRAQMALLVGKTCAAIEDGYTDHAQKRAVEHDLQPRLEAIRDISNTAELDAAIRDAHTCFHMIFGRAWRPRPGNTVAAAAKARGITL